MSYHALRSPSGAYVWTDCTASPEAQVGRPDNSGNAARVGTCGHQMAAECLELGIEPKGYVGRTMVFWRDEAGKSHEDWADKVDELHEHEVIVDDELASAVSVYVNFVRQLRDTLGATMLVEQAVPIDHLTGEDGATGTSDCVLLAGDTRISIDLKLGRGRVTAYDIIEPAGYDLLTGEPTPPKTRMNLQCAMYTLGSLRLHGSEGVTHTKAIIVQPFLSAVSEYECEVSELIALGDWIRSRAEAGHKNPEFKPSGKNCHFCRAKYDCHARNAVALSTALDGFEDVATARPKPISLPKLGDLYSVIDMIRSWCDDIEAKVQEELDAGRPVSRSDGLRYELKEGRKPAREWDNPEEVRALFKSMRLKEDVYLKSTLVSPTEAEKKAEKPVDKKAKRKGKEPAKSTEPKPIGKIQWNRLSAHITQGDPKPVIALETDPRPKYVKRDAVGFADVATTTDDLSDLM